MLPAALPLLSLSVLAAFCAPLACARWSPTFEAGPDDTLVHRELGFRIHRPAPVGGVEWERKSLDDTELAFQQAVIDENGERLGTATLTMMTGCREFPMRVQLEAQSLQLGVSGAKTTFSAPLSHLGYPGWEQRFEAPTEGGTVHVGAVTLLVGPCTYDWVIVTPADSRELFDAFSAWWSGFVPGPAEEGAAPDGDVAGADPG